MAAIVYVYPVDIFSNVKETLTYPESELLTPGVELGGGGGKELSFLASECHILIHSPYHEEIVREAADLVQESGVGPVYNNYRNIHVT